MRINIERLADEVTELQERAAFIHTHPQDFGITKEIISKAPQVKGGKNDYTSRVDQKVEAELKPILLSLIPNCGFLGEETSSSGMENRYRWIMDPTDGTAVYSLGGEYYSNSLALIDREAYGGRGSVILGSVYQSAKDKQFLMIRNDLIIRENIQTKEGSSFIERIPVASKSTNFAEFMGCSFGTSFHYDANPGMEEKLEKVFEKQQVSLADKKYSMINARPASGSSALFCCDIADGERHFALLFYQKAWDLAVGAVYAKRAGCPIVMFDNSGKIIKQTLESSIAQCDKKTILNVGVFANKDIQEHVLKKFYEKKVA